MFSCEFCEIYKNIFFKKHLRATPSGICKFPGKHLRQESLFNKVTSVLNVTSMKEFQNNCARLLLIILLNTSEQMFPNTSSTSDITVKTLLKIIFPNYVLGKLLQNQLKWSNRVIYQEHLFRKIFKLGL